MTNKLFLLFQIQFKLYEQFKNNNRFNTNVRKKKFILICQLSFFLKNKIFDGEHFFLNLSVIDVKINKTLDLIIHLDDLNRQSFVFMDLLKMTR